MRARDVGLPVALPRTGAGGRSATASTAPSTTRTTSPRRARRGSPCCSARTPTPTAWKNWDPDGRGGVADYVPIEVNPFLADVGLIDPVDCFESALPANRLGEVGRSHRRHVEHAAARGGQRPAPRWAWSSPLSPTDFASGVRRAERVSPQTARPPCLVDGSVRFIPNSTDLRILGRLSTRAGGEVIGDW